MESLKRDIFHIARSAEYFDKNELQAQTGQPVEAFGEVVLKELIDNALDACESAGIEPVLQIGYAFNNSQMRLMVADNGTGISSETIDHILNFDTRTSDKAAYKSPSRGAQGNALKTIVGIPHALGGGKVIIESQGLRHEIIATATPAGTIDISHTKLIIDSHTGTAIVIDMPLCLTCAVWWTKATAIFNPHAVVKITRFDDLEFSTVNLTKDVSKNDIFYNRLSECLKIKPNEATSPHWYDRSDFEKLVYLQGVQHDVELGKFIRQFKGLSATGRAKQITRSMAGYRLVSDIYKDSVAIESMRLLMQEQSKPVQPRALGAIGEVNLLARIEAHRHWYKQATGMIDNIPYVFEILIAETSETDLYFGVNHSATFGDFLGKSRIKAGELNGAGIAGVLSSITDYFNVTVIAHLIGIGLPFLDRGKSSLSLPQVMLDDIAKAVWIVAKPLHKELKRKQKDVAKADRAAQVKDDGMTLKSAVFAVMAKSIDAATDQGRLPANVRALFYKVRDAIQSHTDKPLDYNYFSQNLLIDYWQSKGRNPLIYNDPRGVLYEPHSDYVLQLGSFEVADYVFPDYGYNKILYIEKKGLWHTLKAANLHKKYDMAVIAGEGYSSEAIRILLDKAQTGQNYTLFVLHDADPDGYNIARTIQGETKRMPDHCIRVVDLGLTIRDAVDMSLSPEDFTRKKQLTSTLDLNAIERDYFEGTLRQINGKKSWVCKRVELNAMSAGQLVDYVDKAIQAALDSEQIDNKVIPPEPVLYTQAIDVLDDTLNVMVNDFINEQLNLDALKATLSETFRSAFEGLAFETEVAGSLKTNPHDNWNDSIKQIVGDKMQTIQGRIDTKISELVMSALST